MSWTHYLPDDRLKWTAGIDSYPIWPSEPNIPIIENIVRSVLSRFKGGHQAKDQFSVEFFADGARHKVYEVKHPSWPISYLFRVAVAVDPHLKLESEMATLQFLRQYTTIPTARPIAWNSSASNELGYEWCLIEKQPGVELREVWRQMPWEKKLDLADELAVVLSQLWSPKLKFREIGSLYLNDSPHGEVIVRDEGNLTFHVGPCVDGAFFAGRRRYLDCHRGPYLSCRSWLASLIEVEREVARTAKALLEDKGGMTPAHQATDWTELVEDELEIDDEDDFLGNYEALMEVCDDYVSLLPTVFPPEESPMRNVQPDLKLRNASVGNGQSSDRIHDDRAYPPPLAARFALHHSDLRDANILVDADTFKMTAIIDWETAMTVPDWYSRDYPLLFKTDEPLDEREPPIPGTYDEEDENYNGAVVASRDRWELRLLRSRFDEKLASLGWKDWKRSSRTDDAKLYFIQGVSELNNSLNRAKRRLNWATEALSGSS
ncbi:Altered inheritance of mitochondria protein 9, mitochondrial [Madurella mycetomatis]|uniref:Altered inheritance of mitochondria protein 9, mitochondrial n=1 Tax=Madurella mycetomatis TaxID=100816 RepID=A0A175W2R7_9PEZI|nr:Altered inheritance of mitochondria protein 9, mitochondrial [Madurella mycetomatis]